MSHPAPEGPPRIAAPLLNLSSPRRIHVVGIGGPGMSSIAIILHKWGHRVTGSDVRQSSTTDALIELGIPVVFSHDRSHVDDAEIVTYSTAIPDDNVEVHVARQNGAIVLHRGDVLGSISAQRRGVGVVGTHGKTTTTSLLMVMLRASGNDVSYVIGAEVRDTGISADSGNSDLLVVEMDESDGTAEVVPVEGLVVLNVDIDHLDYFGTEQAIVNTFAEMIARVPGPVVINGDDANSMLALNAIRRDVPQGDNRRIITFGHSENVDVRIMNFNETEQGSVFDIVINGETTNVSLPLRGAHNAMNCAASLAMAVTYGASIDRAAKAAATFQGVDRRFEEHGYVRNALLIDDYAHLPAEIEAVVHAAVTHPHRSGKVIAVFQPNRFHRVAQMADDYAHCFSQADVVVITDIYASGTQPIEGVTGKLIADAIVKQHPDANVVWAPSRSDVLDAVLAHLSAGDVCISMGCGDIGNLPEEIMQRVSS